MATADVFTPPGRYLAREELLAPCRALMSTTVGMIRDGKRWLPVERGEIDWGPENEYAERLERSTLTPFYQRAVDDLTGRVFRCPPKLKDDVPSEIAGGGGYPGGLAENIDRRGNDLRTFMRHTFRAAMAEGMCGVLVDYPQVGDAATHADELAGELRPFWSRYTAGCILEAEPDYSTGAPRLRRLRLLEPRVECGPETKWVEKVTPYVRVVTRGSGFGPAAIPARWELWTKNAKGEAEPALRERDGVTEAVAGEFRGRNGAPIVEIPFVLVPAGIEVGWWDWMPLLLDLAYGNLRHWRVKSDLDNRAHVTLSTVMTTTLSEAEWTVKDIGPRRVVFLGTKDGREGKLENLSNDTGPMTLAVQMLKDIEAECRWMAMQPTLTQQGGNPTATAASIETAEAHSQLQDRALALQDATEELLRITALYLGLDSGGSVEYELDFLEEGADPAEVELIKWALAGDGVTPYIDPAYGIERLAEIGAFGEDFDVERALMPPPPPPKAAAPPVPPAMPPDLVDAAKAAAFGIGDASANEIASA